MHFSSTENIVHLTFSSPLLDKRPTSKVVLEAARKFSHGISLQQEQFIGTTIVDMVCCTVDSLQARQEFYFDSSWELVKEKLSTTQAERSSFLTSTNSNEAVTKVLNSNHRMLKEKYKPYHSSPYKTMQNVEGAFEKYLPVPTNLTTLVL